MHRPSEIPHFTPQLMEEVSPRLKVVYVLPWRSKRNIGNWLKRINNLASSSYDAELIIVLHSFQEDADEVIAGNLAAYWEFEKLKPKLAREGLVLHTVNMIGLEQEWKNTALPYLIGMDEALQRLSDAGNLNGIIATLSGDEHYSPNFTRKLINSYQENTSLVAAESNWEYPVDDASLPESIFKAAVHHELLKKLDYQRLKKSGYPFPVMGNPALFSIKGWMYQKVRPSIQNIDCPFQQLLHHAALAGGSIGLISDLYVYPNCKPGGKSSLRKWQQTIEQKLEMELIIANTPYQELHNLLTYFPNFYHGNTLNDYQTIIRKLPQTVCAFLSDEHFFDRWKEMKSESRNLEQFKRKFYQWLSPQRVQDFISFSASHFNQFEEIKSAASDFLNNNHGIRASMMDEEQLLWYFRNPDGKLKVVSKQHRA